MNRISTFISETFGGVVSSSNTKLNATGSNNRGSISSTSNLSIFATNCDLSISSTSNANFQVKNTNFTCTSGSNLKFEGDGNTVVLHSNNKSRITADECNITAKSNSNLDLKACKSTLSLKSNSDANIQVSETKVTAESNSDLKLVGQPDGVVDIKNTKHHLVEPTTGTKPTENRIEFSDASYVRTFLTGALGSWFHSSNDNTPNIVTALTYHKLVEIDRYQYNLDNVNFTLEPLSETMFNVRISNGEFTGNLVNSSEYVVTTNIDGRIQQLKFVAPKISSISTESNLICMSIG